MRNVLQNSAILQLIASLIMNVAMIRNVATHAMQLNVVRMKNVKQITTKHSVSVNLGFINLMFDLSVHALGMNV